MKTAPYASWRSPITSDLIVGKSIGLSEVRIDSTGIYWLESRPHEGGRSVIVHDGVDMAPPRFNVRTRVHEYGGGAWTVSNGDLYFSHDADQRLYVLRMGSTEPAAITPAGKMRFSDGLIDGGRWIGVCEDHAAGDQNCVNTLVAIDLGS